MLNNKVNLVKFYKNKLIKNNNKQIKYNKIQLIV